MTAALEDHSDSKALLFDPRSRLLVDEIQILGSRCGPFPTALERLASRNVDPTPLIDDIYPRSEAAVEHAARPGTMKILLDPTR